jgi:DNA repair protein RecO (recombination protein O)
MNLNERIYKSEAVVLRRVEFAEADYLLTLYTPRHGKMKAVAKGARKPTSRSTGQVELYTRTHFVLNAGRELHIITQAETLESYLPLQESLELGLYASHFVEMLDQFAFEGESQPSAYDLIVNGLGWLCEPEADLKLAARYFEFQLLRVMGYEPALFKCAVSGDDLEAQDQYFCSAEGGVVAPQHTAGLDVMMLSFEAFKVMRHFSRQRWEVVRALQLSEKHHKELERILHHYLTYLLERRMKSLGLLKQLNQQ